MYKRMRFIAGKYGIIKVSAIQNFELSASEI